MASTNTTANVTIDHQAFCDRRIAYLGELAGYSHMEALGRMATLWSVCTAMQTDRPGIGKIRACLGAGGDVHLLESELGELMEAGEIRVKGCVGRIEWYAKLEERNAAGGKVRATTAARTSSGRFLPAASPALAPAAQPNPASGSDLPEEDTPAARARTIPVLPTTEPPDPRAADPERDHRQEIRRKIWSRLAEVRNAIAAEFGLTVRPLPVQDSGERALAMWLLEAGDRGEADAMHVVDVYAAEARATRSVQWLTGGMFEERSRRRALGMTTGDAMKKARAAPANDRGMTRFKLPDPEPTP